MATRKTRSRFDPAVLDELLKGQDPQTVLRSQGLLGELKKALAERMLNAEMDVHLDQPLEHDAGNHRNGSSAKTVLSEDGPLELAIPRDRHGRFDPALIGKYQRRFPGFDQKIIALYARGMSTRDIRGPRGRTLRPGDLARAGVGGHRRGARRGRARQERPLDPVYALVYFDALRVKIRDEGLVRNKAVYLAIGVNCEGYRDVLGIWIEHTEGARFWLRVMSELKARGTRDILIAVVDGLKGFPEAIVSVFPQTVVQTCIVHLLRNSMQFATWKERAALAAALRPVYTATGAEAAEQELARFEAGEWGQRYRAIVPMWRRQWEEVVPFFAFTAPVRTLIYTTNAIESLHSEVRKSIRNKGHFPSDEAALKLIWLSLRYIVGKWTNRPLCWSAARTEFAIQFEDRFTVGP
ncbi:IS256 family transposase [Paraburkholderia sp.]|uniref:IS256 family transposase n=1 Tax=Paraburkholderia sp. TaxID=1926495 RepID=UPI0023845A49|nr:IS256 family transposase [Paraburkholderia sp.]MDE1184120.1 IS256 family transposase [Paraburkholderia sp.]